MKQQITLQIHFQGKWHDAATLNIANADEGYVGKTVLAYDMGYYFSDWNYHALETGAEICDSHSLSVFLPPALDNYRLPTWPSFLLDILPQGHAREVLAQRLGYKNSDDRSLDFKLLMWSGSSPIGNVRVKEAVQDEAARLKGVSFAGLSLDDILQKTDRFVETAEMYAMLASGSSGAQGEWPKLLLTKKADELWYPDSLVADADARDHMLVKLLRGKGPADLDILANEAPYMKVADAFGLRTHRPLQYDNGVLIIYRFDRAIRNGWVEHIGQESLVAAAGVAEFGYSATHEQYLEVIKTHCANPKAEIIEYVLRDVLNTAMGNPDNHGRNTALAKYDNGRIELTPLFDFSPMRLDDRVVARSTKWKCLQGRDFNPDWAAVAEVAAVNVCEPQELIEILSSKADFVAALPTIAKELGVSQTVIDRAMSRHMEVSVELEKLKGNRYAAR